MEISTTYTFDKLFKKLPKTIQKKAVKKQTYSKATRFILPYELKSYTPRDIKYGAFESTFPIELFLNLLILIMLNLDL